MSERLPKSFRVGDLVINRRSVRVIVGECEAESLWEGHGFYFWFGVGPRWEVVRLAAVMELVTPTRIVR